MLVVTRKCEEAVVLPDQGVTVKVLEVRGDRVRLGISAPIQVPVHRHEVWERIHQGGETAPRAEPAASAQG